MYVSFVFTGWWWHICILSCDIVEEPRLVDMHDSSSEIDGAYKQTFNGAKTCLLVSRAY